MSKQETSHTPGPWEVFKSHTGHYVLDSAEQAAVCKVEWCLEAEANARLIAAAPELLAALKRLRDDVQTAHVGADERCKDCAVCWSLKLADAAIAKAEGRAVE